MGLRDKFNSDMKYYYIMKRRFVLKGDLQMKKLIILALAIVMAGTVTACGMGDVGGPNSSGSAQSAASQAVSSAVGSQDMEDNLAGLQKYLAANSVVSGDPAPMKADFIGAKSGVKYHISNSLSIELYEFDPSGLNSEANRVLSDTKSKGSFTVMGTTVPAVVSDSGKYLMIYRETASNDESKTHESNAIKLFKEFKKS